MFCRECGKEMLSEDRFCHACGTAVESPDKSVEKVPEIPVSKKKHEEKLPKQKKPKRKRRYRWIFIILLIPILLISSVYLLRFIAPEIFPINFQVGDENLVIAIPDKDNITDDMQATEPDFKATLTAMAQLEPAQALPVDTEEPEQPPPVKSVAGPDLIFSEDFESEMTSAVPLFSSEYMGFSTVSGQGLLSGYEPGVLPIFFSDFSVADFIAEFEFMTPEAYEDTACGFIFRADETLEDGLDTYYALFIFPQQNAFRVGLWIDGEWYKTDKMEFPEPLNVGYALNRIRFEVIGGDMTLYANDEFVSGFYEDTVTQAGLLGFFISPSASLPTGEIDAVLLDNFMVFAP